MNEYLQKLVSNFARLRDLSIKLNGSSDSQGKSVNEFYEFITYLSIKIPSLIIIPQGITIEDNFCPYSTYQAFIEHNKDNKDLLEELSYDIDKIVIKLTKTGIFDENCIIESFPNSKMREVFESINEDDLQKIKELADKLSENLKATPFLDFIWREEVQKFLLEKQVKAQKDIEKKKIELNQQKVELKVSEEWYKHFEDRAKAIRKEIRLLNSKKFKIFPGKIASLRFLIYLIPVLSGFVALFKIMMDQKWSFVHYEFLVSILLIISILSYHLKHALRELNILKHMRSSYLHRAIVAKTFQSLVATDHFKGKKGDTVVKEAALAMFKKETQGYLSKDQMEPSNTPLQEIVGIFKNK